MADFPRGEAAGVLAFLFLRKLCARLAFEGTLPSKEEARIWAEIEKDLENDATDSANLCRQWIQQLKLTKG